MADEWELKIAKLDLSHGDILVVRSDPIPTAERERRLCNMMHQIVPSGVRVMFIGPEIELSVLTKAEIEAKAA